MHTKFQPNHFEVFRIDKNKLIVTERTERQGIDRLSLLILKSIRNERLNSLYALDNNSKEFDLYF